jgi:hypothetical protein
MPLALVTGTPPDLGPAAATLGRAGFDVVVWPTTADAGAGPAGPFDCYLQLPCGPRNCDGRGRMAAPDLVCRIDGLAAVARLLRPDASIILGVEDGIPGVEDGDVSAPTAAGDLLVAVALALLEDLGRPAARIAVLPVAELCQAPEESGVGTIAPAVQWEMPTPPLVSAP